eukprot:CAMPEP_0195303780 /NCGR_PEP_ID=MMETSP0707-20130614/33359_1 /TAXON_ID=33640 /ORGANISM="Asterionellopsis glacialis, Strain CCMP134" /LENGTH=340 /DNA_ID=CAMNT_0040367425 /DNA_START=278 /DNA_END=1297 /DNA_ORIENTATION=+
MCVPDRQSTNISESSTLEEQFKQEVNSSSSFFFSKSTGTSNSNLKTTLISTLGGTVTAIVILAFSLWFPFFLAPLAATNTYHSAFYQYDADSSKFDNSAWTYVTDYILCGIMAVLVVMCLYASGGTFSQQLRRRSAGLLSMYMISVLAGGYSHQNFTTLESRNTWTFRFLWTVCVGTVTAAGGFMGLCGSEVARASALLAQQESNKNNNHNHGILVPVIPDSFWIAFGAVLSAFCAYGGISYQRPACDIFIAGTTQFPPTAYIMGIVALRNWNHPPANSSATKATPTTTSMVSMTYQAMCHIGFILNAPLLPMYPLLVQYTDWSLASVNTLLHSWLLVAW